MSRTARFRGSQHDQPELKKTHCLEAIIFSVAFNLLGFALLILLGYLLVVDPRHFGGPTVAFLAAGLCLLFGNLDRIDTLSASVSGFEAKTREAQNVLNDAKDTLALLRKLAVVTASLQVKLLAAEGRLQGPDRLMQKDEQKDQLLSELKRIGLDDDELTKVAAADRAWVMWDYVIAILQPINSETDRQKVLAYTKAYKRYTNPLSPEECEDLLNQFHANSDQTKALLDDYRYYMKYGKQRRPEVWRARPSGLQVTPTAILPLH